jgi:hypothetical protein
MLTCVLVIAAVLAVIFIPRPRSVYARAARVVAIMFLAVLGLQAWKASVVDPAVLTWIELALLAFFAILIVFGSIKTGRLDL